MRDRTVERFLTRVGSDGEMPGRKRKSISSTTGIGVRETLSIDGKVWDVKPTSKILTTWATDWISGRRYGQPLPLLNVLLRSSIRGRYKAKWTSIREGGHERGQPAISGVLAYVRLSRFTVH